MKLESITLRLRPRGPYEATDLGVRLVQRNARAAYAAWCVFVLPACLFMLPLVTVASWLPALAIWWLKPLYDRVVLFVLSRAVFGEQVRLADLAVEWRQILGNGLVWALTFRRFDFARSFTLPLDVLERVTGKRRRQRSRVLQKSARGNAVLLTIAWLHIEQALVFSLVMLVTMLLPLYADVPVFAWLFGDDGPLWFKAVVPLFFIGALSIAEPFYVASGFTLYLNRRIDLEAWDIELDLKRNIRDDAGEALERAA